MHTGAPPLFLTLCFGSLTNARLFYFALSLSLSLSLSFALFCHFLSSTLSKILHFLSQMFCSRVYRHPFVHLYRAHSVSLKQGHDGRSLPVPISLNVISLRFGASFAPPSPSLSLSLRYVLSLSRRGINDHSSTSSFAVARARITRLTTKACLSTKIYTRILKNRS